jgi:hypothetical protein
MDKPHIIEFNRVGESGQGFISIAEGPHKTTFDIKRVFWTYHTPESIVRGRHAHHETEMILVAVAGRIIVNTEMPNGDLEVFTLDRPNVGVFIPKKCWHTMQYSHNAVQLVMASTNYSEQDYVRNYEDFRPL